MCRIAYDDGIRTIVATPHFRPGSIEHPHERVQCKIHELRTALNKANIPLEILPGADVTITPELDDHLEYYPYLTINGNGKYFLAEFPHATVPPNWDTFLYAMIRKGKTPVITHPERNGWFLSHPEALSPFVSAGGLVQITAMSLTGEVSEAVKKYSLRLLRQGLVNIIATDAHSVEQRRPILSEAVAVAASVIGKDRALSMVLDTPRALIEGRRPDLPIPEPVEIPRRSWLGRLLRA